MKYQVLLEEDSKAIQQMYRHKLIMEQFALSAVAFSCPRCQAST